MSITSNRATKGAYLCDLQGGHIVDFQFSPETLEFNEGGRFNDRIITGRHDTDYIWISGQPTRQNIKMWVDRTLESNTQLDQTSDPYSSITKLPKSAIPRYADFDVVNFINGVKNGLVDLYSKARGIKDVTEQTSLEPSTYAVSPNFNQATSNDSKGVFYDVELLAYFLRPEGYELAKATNTNGVISIDDVKQTRFIPPPKCRYFYGNYWAEGYIQEVEYKLSVMNDNLVPMRMEADIVFLRTKWGYLNELTINTNSNG